MKKNKIYLAGCGGMLGEAFYKRFKQGYDLKCTIGERAAIVMVQELALKGGVQINKPLPAIFHRTLRLDVLNSGEWLRLLKHVCIRSDTIFVFTPKIPSEAPPRARA